LLQNKAGEYVAPGTGGGEAALASAKLPADLIAWVPDPEGAKAYPITTFTWMLFYKQNSDPKNAAALRSMVEYGVTDGQKVADQMGYVPLPANVVAEVKKAAANIQ